MGSDIKSALRPTVVMLLLFALLLCGLYPLAVLGLGQAVFPAQANGSLIRDGDRIVGSSLIGQGLTPSAISGRVRRRRARAMMRPTHRAPLWEDRQRTRLN